MARSATDSQARTEGAGTVADDRTAVAPTGHGAASPAAPETVTVRVQLRPRRAAVRRCLAVLAELAAQHGEVPFALEGMSSDDRCVRLTLGIDLGPQAEIAKFGPAAQAAYGFVNALFVSLYDHMPVYAGEPSEAERAAARTVLAAGDAAAAEVSVPVTGVPADVAALTGARAPAAHAVA